MIKKTSNNLYELFDCNSKEELYSLVREKAEQVQPLLNYMDYVKGNIANRNKRIISPEILGQYLGAVELPKDKNGTMLFVDTKHYPLLLEKINLDKRETIIDAMKKGVIAGANSAFLALDSLFPLKEEIEEIKNMMKTLGLKFIDTMHYNDIDKSMYSMEKKDKIYNPGKQNIIHPNKGNSIEYSEKEEYLNFANFYAKKKVMNLDIIKDIDEIKNIMKIGYQHNKQEVFGCISYDKNNRVIKAEDIALGGLNATIVDPRTVLRNLLTIENLKGVAFYHNHPTGDSSPSNEDINITHRLIDNLNNFNIEYFDHFIIGKEKVFSFVDEVFGCESMNIEYQDWTLTREKEEKYNSNIPIKKGDVIKTALSENTIVLKVEADNALLFTGRQFIVAHNIQKEDDFVFWGHGHYYDELDDVYIEPEEEKELDNDWDMEM